MKDHKKNHSIELIASPLSATSTVQAIDNVGQKQTVHLVREQPLTIYLNRKTIVTVMTMGAEPAHLIVGFLLNQGLIQSVTDIRSVHVDWSVNAGAVYADNVGEQDNTPQDRIITSGCGQGTMFATVMNNLQQRPALPDMPPISTAQIYHLLSELSQENTVYKQAGGVHSCALCTHTHVIKTIEDVGRHNALDSLAGFWALQSPSPQPTLMYTTGRLTSEMVIKTAQMGLSLIISRSGATAMGVEIAEKTGITLVSRAKGKRFLVLTHPHNVG